MAIGFFMPMALEAGASPKLLRAHATLSWTPLTSSAVKTVANAAIGDPSPDRFVVVVLGRNGSAANTSPTSMTIGGVAASLVYDTGSNFNVWGALVPTGTTANIVVNYNVAVGDLRAPIHIFSLTGYKSAVPVIMEYTASGGGSSPRSASLSATTVGNGVQLLAAHTITGNPSNLPVSALTPAVDQAESSFAGGMTGIISNNGTPTDGSTVSVSATGSWSGGGSSGGVSLINVVWR